MKTVLLTLNIGDCLDANSRASFLDACRRWGCQYIEVTEAREGVHPHAMKLLAFEIYDADRIFYIDADTIIRGDTPNPFETFKDDNFVAIRNQQPHMPEASQRACSDTIETDVLAIISKFEGVRANKELFVNSGVWLASREHHAETLQLAFDVSIAMYGKTQWKDQSALNYAIWSRETKLTLASDEWNWQFPPDTGQRKHMTAFIYHWAGNEHRERIPKVNWYAKGFARPELIKLLCERQYQAGVEIGVQEGDHATMILKAWPGFLHLVDPWRHQDSKTYPCMANVDDAGHEQFYRRTVAQMAAFPGRHGIIRDFSAAAAERFENESLDFIYIDGNHTYDAVIADLQAWYPKVKPGGLISGHDFTFDGNKDLPHGGCFGIKPAVHDFLADKQAILYVAKQEEWPTWHFFKAEAAGDRPRLAAAPERKPRMIWVGDAVVQTGFARVTHNVCEHLQHHWDLHVIGLNYMGDPHSYPYPIWPARTGGDMWGYGRLAELLPKLRPELVCVLNDPWIIMRFPELKGNIPLAAYMPIDARNVAEGFCQALNNVDLVLTYTEFGLQELRRGGFAGKAEVIPHGVDTSLYRPKHRGVARQRLNFSQVIDEEAFIFGNVNRNQPRKRLDLTIEYFAEWVHTYRPPPNVYLYLHCAQRDSGWDLAQLGHYYGITGRLMLLPEEYTPSNGFAEREMPFVYSSMDCQISTTEGEGWGLPQIEGMACGVPQIMPDYAGLGEWAAGAALMVPCTSFASHISINTIGGIPDKNAFAQALEAMYRNKALRSQYAGKALDRAREKRFRWSEIGDSFQRHLGQMIIDHAEKRKKAEENGNESVQGAGSSDNARVA